MIENYKKKSLKERFLLIIGMLFFAVYFALGLVVIFWKKFPLAMELPYRIAFGCLLVGYALIRFVRLMNQNV